MIHKNILKDYLPGGGWGGGGGGGGGGGYSDLVLTGVCAAEAAKPVPIFKGHFGGKGYPLWGVFIQENYVFVYFSNEMGKNTCM